MSLTKVTYSMIKGAPVSALDYGADPTGVADSSAAIQAAIDYVYFTNNGGTVALGQGGTYKLLSPVIIPPYVTVDLNGSTVVGGGVGTNALFQSGYDDNGTIVTNINNPTPEAPGTTTPGLRITNGKIKDAGIAIHLFNAIWQSEISDIEFENVTQAVKSRRSFYSRYKNLISTGNAGGETDAAFTFDFYINVEAIESVFVSDRVLGIAILASSSGLKLLNCSAENCTTGIYLANNQAGGAYSIEFDTCYIESNTTGIDVVSGVEANGITFNNCFINNNTTGISLYSFGGIGQFDIRKNTSFANNTKNILITSAEEEKLNTNVDCNSSLITPYLVDDTNLSNIGGISKIDAPYAINRNAIINLYSTAYSTIAAKVDWKYNSIIPFLYDGDSGSGFNDKVLSATIAQSAVATSFTLYVNTTITYREDTMGLVFRIKVETISETFVVYGFILGDNVVQLDANAATKTVTISNLGGLVRLSIANVSSANTNYTARGFVRHM